MKRKKTSLQKHRALEAEAAAADDAPFDFGDDGSNGGVRLRKVKKERKAVVKQMKDAFAKKDPKDTKTVKKKDMKKIPLDVSPRKLAEAREDDESWAKAEKTRKTAKSEMFRMAYGTKPEVLLIVNNNPLCSTKGKYTVKIVSGTHLVDADVVVTEVGK